ncbi:hypothetical protein CR513_11948, partial [Mucuna pruriens]
MCVDYSNLNKACHKDSYPLSSINQLVDWSMGHHPWEERGSKTELYAGFTNSLDARPKKLGVAISSLQAGSLDTRPKSLNDPGRSNAVAA